MYVMVIYGVLACWILAAMFRQRTIDRKTQIIAAAAVLLFFVLRFNVGPDTNIYVMLFKRVATPIADAFKYESQRNVGFNLLLYTVKALFHEYRYFVLVSNLIIAGLMTSTVLRFSKDILLSLILFIGSGTLEVYYSSGVRQAISMFIFLYAFYRYLPKKEYWRYELFCLLALSFHETALLAMLVPLLAVNADRIRSRRRNVLIWTSCISLGVLGIVYWFSKGITTIDYSSKLAHLLIYMANPSFSFLGLAQEIVLMGMVLVLYRLADPAKTDAFDYVQLLVCWLAFFLYLAFSSHAIVSRAADYLQVIYIVFLPKLLWAVPSPKKRILSFCFIAMLNLFLLYADLSFKTKTISASGRHVMTVESYPYISIFDQDVIGTYLVSGDDAVY